MVDVESKPVPVQPFARARGGSVTPPQTDFTKIATAKFPIPRMIDLNGGPLDLLKDPRGTRKDGSTGRSALGGASPYYGTATGPNMTGRPYLNVRHSSAEARGHDLHQLKDVEKVDNNDSATGGGGATVAGANINDPSATLSQAALAAAPTNTQASQDEET